MLTFMISFGVLTGGFFSIQAAINSRLSKNTPSPFNASLIAFAVGSLLLFLLIIVFDLDKAASIDFTYPLYIYVGGGISGVIFNVSNVFLFKNIGASTTTFLTVATQIVVGAIFDAAGFLNLPVQEITIRKCIGILLMVFSAYLLSRNNQKNSTQKNRDFKQGKWYLLACAVGVFAPLQSILNGQLKVVAGSPIIASFISFTVGLILLIVITLVIQRKIILPRNDSNGKRLPWWIYIGGLFGVLVVGGTATIISEFGSVLTTSLFLTGQLIMSTIIDHKGLFGLEKKKINIQKIGIVIVMVASLFIFI